VKAERENNVQRQKRERGEFQKVQNKKNGGGECREHPEQKEAGSVIQCRNVQWQRVIVQRQRQNPEREQRCREAENGRCTGRVCRRPPPGEA